MIILCLLVVIPPVILREEAEQFSLDLAVFEELLKEFLYVGGFL